MPSRLDALQTTGSVALRRFLGGFHSVAKQTSLNVALEGVFIGFWKALGRFLEAKTEGKIDF